MTPEMKLYLLYTIMRNRPEQIQPVCPRR